MYEKKKLSQILIQEIMDPKILEPINFLSEILGPNRLWSHKFGSKLNFGSKHIGQKILSSKKFCSKNFSIQKIFFGRSYV